MPIKRRINKRRHQDLDDDALDWLVGGSGGEWAYFQTASELSELWSTHGAATLADWAAEHPGSRPAHWWRYAAPEHRRQVGGSGDFGWRGEAACPEYRVGLPYPVWSVDPDDPPRFESQAAYLDRLRLWLPGERRRAPAKLFEPELITG